MPASYQAPMRRDKVKKKTTSQTVATNAIKDTSIVRDVLGSKGNDVITITPQDTLATAVQVLHDKRIGALVVIDEAGKLVGILSERDIVRKLAETPGQTLPQTVSENMTRDVVTCAPSDVLVDVLRRMSEGRFRHMPVLDGQALIGMVTIGDVVTHRLREVEHEALQLKQLIVG